MKKYLLIGILALQYMSLSAQTPGFVYRNPRVKAEISSAYRYVHELSPDLFRNLQLEVDVRKKLEKRRKDYSIAYYLYPNAGYTSVMELAYVKLTATVNGKVEKAESNNGEFTKEQKRLLGRADINTIMDVRIQFRFKKQAGDKDKEELMDGFIEVNVVPAHEAVFPGGEKEFEAYLHRNILDKLNESDASQPYFLNFTVDEKGQVSSFKLPQLKKEKPDPLLEEAIRTMPRWKPAQNHKGEKVKQTFSLQIGFGC